MRYRLKSDPSVVVECNDPNEFFLRVWEPVPEPAAADAVSAWPPEWLQQSSLQLVEDELDIWAKRMRNVNCVVDRRDVAGVLDYTAFELRRLRTRYVKMRASQVEYAKKAERLEKALAASKADEPAAAVNAVPLADKPPLGRVQDLVELRRLRAENIRLLREDDALMKNFSAAQRDKARMAEEIRGLKAATTTTPAAETVTITIAHDTLVEVLRGMREKPNEVP